ncbi:MAG: ATP-binding protein [Chloroflexi bacterium]|nr:ATP-binding protein [Chloroflexota bacterium]
MKNAGLSFPHRRVTVNLAPASLRKEGPAHDLPIALGVLTASGQVPLAGLEGAMVVGELSLDGSVRHVRGVLPIVALARRQAIPRMYVPAVDSREAALVPDVEVIPIENLAQLAAHLGGRLTIPALRTQPEPIEADLPPLTDFSEVRGQEHVKRALEVAAAGVHNVLMAGPPAAGKTLLARALPFILSRLTLNEALDVTRVYSVADMLPAEVRRFCKLDEAGTALLRTAMAQLQLTARSYHRVLKIARTIADLSGAEVIRPAHLAKALQYRPRQVG